MTEVMAHRPSEGLSLARLPGWVHFALIMVAGVLLSLVWEGATRWPEAWVIPAEPWLTGYIEWLKNDATIFGVEFKEITRGIGAALKAPVKWAEYLLYRGFKGIGLGPLPWVAVAAGVIIFAHWVGDWKLVALCVFSMIYLAVFNVWKDSMKTMTIVIVAVPMAALLGVVLGIWVTRSRIAERIFTPMFDLMQAIPHMAYLAPVAALFAFGPVTALIATVIFAMPPMARCTILGLQTVSSDVLEAGQMSGCTKRQALWKVALPSSKRTLMLGLNQVVMQTLAMVVIASIAGATGLGHKLLYSLQQLRLGVAIEQGIAITLIAIVLDRLTQAYAYKETDHFAAEKSWVQRHKHMLTFLVILVVSYIAAEFYRWVNIPPSKFTYMVDGEKVTLFDAKQLARTIDAALREFNTWAYPYINPIRDWTTINVLIPTRDFFLWLPWPVFVGVIALAALRLGGLGVMLLCIALAMSFIVTGFWEQAMKTTYVVLIAATISVLIGVPLGVLAANPVLLMPPILMLIGIIEIYQIVAWLLVPLTVPDIVIFSTTIDIAVFATIAVLAVLFLALSPRLREVIFIVFAIKQIVDVIFWILSLLITLISSIGGGDVSGFSAALMSGLPSAAWIVTALLLLRGVGDGLFQGSPLVNLAQFFQSVTRVILSTCDTLQTFPSFIYLIPAIMLFKIGDFANIFAIIPYAMVPAIRYTYLGLKRIPPVTVEAAIANGTTPMQRLWKVELPVALPEIMLGLNQTILFALAMTAITALIGSTDLGQEVVRSISTQNFGRGILAGLFIAALGIIADRLIGSWAAERKRQLGVA